MNNRRPTIQEIKTYGVAVNQRWPTNQTYRAEIVNLLMRVAIDPESTTREKIAASKVLVAIESQNQKDEHTAAVQSDRNRFLEVAKRLGIDADFRLVTEERASASDGGVDGTEGVRP